MFQQCKGVLLKYKELMRKGENMLIELENQLKILNLEKLKKIHEILLQP